MFVCSRAFAVPYRDVDCPSYVASIEVVISHVHHEHTLAVGPSKSGSECGLGQADWQLCRSTLWAAPLAGLPLGLQHVAQTEHTIQQHFLRSTHPLSMALSSTGSSSVTVISCATKCKSCMFTDKFCAKKSLDGALGLASLGERMEVPLGKPTRNCDTSDVCSGAPGQGGKHISSGASPAGAAGSALDKKQQCWALSLQTAIMDSADKLSSEAWPLPRPVRCLVRCRRASPRAVPFWAARAHWAGKDIAISQRTFRSPSQGEAAAGEVWWRGGPGPRAHCRQPPSPCSTNATSLPRRLHCAGSRRRSLWLHATSWSQT